MQVLADILVVMSTTKNEAKQRRPRRSKQQVDAIIADYRASGMNCMAYAKRAGLNAGALYSWLRVRSVNASPETQFARVNVREERHLAVSSGVVSIRTPDGWSVVVDGALGSSFTAKLLKELLPCLA